MDRPSSDPPVGKATFTAFGQDHTDAKALEAVGAQLKTMHEGLKKTGRKLVIAIERSQEQVLTDPQDIAELHNQGVMQAYFDEMNRIGKPPSLEDFKSKHEKDLRLDAKTLRRLTEQDVKSDFANAGNLARAKGIGPYLQRRQANLLNTEYASRQSKANHDENKGRGASRLQEAAIYQFAKDNGIDLRGLDPLSDKEKSQRLGASKTQTTTSGFAVAGSTGKIDQTALEEMEYERMQGMAENACQTMSELAKAGGGCVVAINMGAAHMASLELAITDRTQKREELRDAKVTTCVLVKDSKDEATAQDEAKKFMQMSAAEMRRCHERRIKKVQSKKETVDFREAEIKERNERAFFLKQQGPEVLAKKMEDPESFAKELCQASNSAAPVSEEVLQEIKEVIATAKKQLGKKKFSDITAALLAILQVDDESIQGCKDDLVEPNAEFQEAQKELEGHREVADFASRVEERLSRAPKGTYVALAGNSKAGYTQGVQALGRTAVDGDVEKSSQAEFLPTSTAATDELTNTWADGDISESDANTILILSQNSPRNEKNSV